MSDETHINLTGPDGRTCDIVPILRHVTLRGLPGFCIHEYKGEYRVSHIETGAYLSRGGTDGEAFVYARRFDKEDLERKIDSTRQELIRLRSMQKQEK